jgi:Zn-dependent protease
MERPGQLIETLHQVALLALPILSAVIFHEIAHGFVALRLGDDTASRLGRLTLNPLPHIDPFGTVLMPLLLAFAGAPIFGYARPVPVDFSRLRHPKRDMVWVALAGPGTNIVLASVSALVLRLLLSYFKSIPEDTDSWFVLSVLVPLAQIARISVLINVSLAVFNMLPLPPLDDVLEVRPRRMARHLRLLPRRQPGIGVAQQLRGVGLELLDLGRDIDTGATAAWGRRRLQLLDPRFQLGDRLLEFQERNHGRRA